MSPQPQRNPRQTQNYLRGLLAANGLEPKSKLGQNFLIDLNLIDLILRTAELEPSDLVLEVGTGTGSLTAELAKAAGAVVSVEVDGDFHRLAQHHLRDLENVTLLHMDILARKNELNPEVLATLDQVAAATGTQRRKLVANLPYVVATPIIGNLLIGGMDIERMVVMVQWEIAERLTSDPGTKEFGALAVLVQSLADVTLVRRLAPSVFWPRPQVDSAIVMIQPDPDKRAHVGDVLGFRSFLRDLYVHKRKNLRQALVGSPQGRRDKTDVDATLAELGIDGGIRAETLSVEDHLRLRAAFAPTSSPNDDEQQDPEL